jgi:hypothetical protein
MTRLLKRWSVLPAAVAFMVIFIVFTLALMLGSAYWLITGHDIAKYGERACEFMFEDYWDKYLDWATR